MKYNLYLYAGHRQAVVEPVCDYWWNGLQSIKNIDRYEDAEEYDPNQGAQIIHPNQITDEMANAAPPVCLTGSDSAKNDHIIAKINCWCYLATFSANFVVTKSLYGVLSSSSPAISRISCSRSKLLSSKARLSFQVY